MWALLVLAMTWSHGEEFLRTANVRPTGANPGTSGSTVVLLEKDGVKAKGIFKPKDLERDNFHNEVLAYKLGRAMGLNVPPTVYRTVRGEKGALQLWIECPTLAEYDGPALDRHEVEAFDRLIRNPDRTEANMLVCDGELVLIDHSRAFQ